MMTLNRRHKAGLFLALVATGLSLVFEASAKQAAGILILGIAVAWLIGSLSLHTLGIVGCLLVCALGVFIAVLPVKDELERYQSMSQDYDFAVSELKEAIAKSRALPTAMPEPSSDPYSQYAVPSVGRALPPGAKLEVPIAPGAVIGSPHGSQHAVTTRTVEIPASAQTWERPSTEWRGSTIVSIPFPGDKSDEEIMAYFQSTVFRPRATFSLRAAALAHQRTVLLGLALAAGGLLGSLRLIWRALRVRRESIPGNA